jgi:tRNA(Arg) A34 adenosine deaminase TadA
MLSNRLIDIATGVALTSSGVSGGKFRTGAILFNKTKVLEAKANVLKTHPKLSIFTQYPYLHAESHCILSHGLDHCTDLQLLVVRVLADNTSLSCAKPCQTCQNLLEIAQVKRVYYSDWNGGIKCL